MKHVFRQWWASRSPRERRAIVVVALGLGLVLYAWLLQATTHARRRLIPAVTQLREQATHQSGQADEIIRLRAMPKPPPSATDLRQLVQRQVDAGGLTRALVSMELVDADHVKLVFGSVAFTDWLTWADSMQAQHLRLAAVRIEAQSADGQVSVTTTLERPQR